MTPLLDPDQLAETRALIGEEAFLQFLEPFEAEVDDLVARLPTASRVDIVAGCHRLAATAGAFGAAALREALLAAEGAGRDPSVPDLPARCDEVARRWVETRPVFAMMRKR